MVLRAVIPVIPFLYNIFNVAEALPVNGGTGELIRTYLSTGVGIGGRTLEAGLNNIGAGGGAGAGLFERLLIEGGIFYLAVFLIAVFFILQRAFNILSGCASKRVCFITASLSAVVLGFLAAGLFYDVWEDIRIYMLFWIVSGMITAVKNVYGRKNYAREAGE